MTIQVSGVQLSSWTGDSIGEISGITIVDPLDGQFLRYTGSTSQWQNSVINHDVFLSLEGTGGTIITWNATTGKVEISGGGGGGAVASVSGTANQITVTPTTGAVVVSLPATVVMPGALILSADPTTALGAATKQYVDAHAGGGGGGSSLVLIQRQTEYASFTFTAPAAGKLLILSQAPGGAGARHGTGGNATGGGAGGRSTDILDISEGDVLTFTMGGPGYGTSAAGGVSAGGTASDNIITGVVSGSAYSMTTVGGHGGLFATSGPLAGGSGGSGLGGTPKAIHRQGGNGGAILAGTSTHKATGGGCMNPFNKLVDNVSGGSILSDNLLYQATGGGGTGGPGGLVNTSTDWIGSGGGGAGGAGTEGTGAGGGGGGIGGPNFSKNIYTTDQLITMVTDEFGMFYHGAGRDGGMGVGFAEHGGGGGGFGIGNGGTIWAGHGGPGGGGGGAVSGAGPSTAGNGGAGSGGGAATTGAVVVGTSGNGGIGYFSLLFYQAVDTGSGGGVPDFLLLEDGIL